MTEMVNDYFKVILPVILTGMGILGWDMNHRITMLEDGRIEGRGYIRIIKDMQSIDVDLVKRMRVAEDKIQIHLVGKHCEQE